MFSCASPVATAPVPEGPTTSNAFDGPIIDMHLHAHAADTNGPPPMALCIPVTEHTPPWDPRTPFPQFMMQLMKEPSCETGFGPKKPTRRYAMKQWPR